MELSESAATFYISRVDKPELLALRDTVDGILKNRTRWANNINNVALSAVLMTLISVAATALFFLLNISFLTVFNAFIVLDVIYCI